MLAKGAVVTNSAPLESQWGHVPATLSEAVEAEALEFARAVVQGMKTGDGMSHDPPLNPFIPADNARLARDLLKKVARTPLGVSDVVDWAKDGWDLAEEVLCELIVEYDERKEDKPTSLIAYNIWLAKRRFRPPEPKTTGPKTTNYMLRDWMLVALVWKLWRRFGLNPTRNLLSKRERTSGCKVVAEACRLEGR
jgi:hypothetical protein